jgi:hypothetical protein
MRTVLFLVAAFTCSRGPVAAQPGTQAYTAFIGDYCFYKFFEPDGDYYFLSSGGSHCTGCYERKGDTIRILTGIDMMHPGASVEYVGEQFIIDSAGDLVSLRSSMAFAPCRKPHQCGCFGVRFKPVKYPQTDTRDTVLKTLVKGQLTELLAHPELNRLLHHGFDTIFLANYYYLNNRTMPALQIHKRPIVFLPMDSCAGRNYIEIQNINLNPDEVSYKLFLHKKIGREVYARFRKKGGWILEHITNMENGKLSDDWFLKLEPLDQESFRLYTLNKSGKDTILYILPKKKIPAGEDFSRLRVNRPNIFLYFNLAFDSSTLSDYRLVTDLIATHLHEYPEDDTVYIRLTKSFEKTRLLHSPYLRKCLKDSWWYRTWDYNQQGRLVGEGTFTDTFFREPIGCYFRYDETAGFISSSRCYNALIYADTLTRFNRWGDTTSYTIYKNGKAFKTIRCLRAGDGRRDTDKQGKGSNLSAQTNAHARSPGLAQLLLTGIFFTIMPYAFTGLSRSAYLLLIKNASFQSKPSHKTLPHEKNHDPFFFTGHIGRQCADGLGPLLPLGTGPDSPCVR